MPLSLRWLLPLFLILGSFFGLAAARAAEVVQLSFNETVRQADAIVTGKVLSKNARWGDASQRWMVTDYEFTVDEVIYTAPGQLPFGKTITLTYWGGTIGGETQSASDVRLPVLGEQLAVMLRAGWQHEVSATPLVGFNQGMFMISPAAAADRTLTVHDFIGTPLAVLPDGRVLHHRDSHALTASAPGASLAAFTSWIKANIAAIKAAPAKPKPVVDLNDPRIIKPFAKTPAVLTGAVRPQASLVPKVVASHLPAADPAAKAPVNPRGADGQQSVGTGSTVPLQTAEVPPITNYPAPYGRANIPIVVNPLPSNFSESPEDQYQMSKWNYYVSDIFHVKAATGTYSWPDGVFDLDGFPQSADLQRIYGYSWDANTIGITFNRSDSSGTILEADIALNPAFSFTFDDESVYNGDNVQPFRQVLTHELGHMHGLNHQFNFLSVMNYMPAQFRYFGLPYMDDAQAARANYSSNVVAHTDLGIYLYYESGYQSVTDATYPSSINAGDVLTVNDYHLENVGTTTVDTPTVQWYLCDGRNYNGNYYFLGSSTYPSMSPFFYFTTNTVSRSFTVPSSVTPGNYYLAAYIPSDDGMSQSSFPFSNNYAFSRFAIQVNPAPPTIIGFSPATGPVGTTVTISGNSFNTVYGVYFNGFSASFTIMSSTQIQATVPSSATTGPLAIYNQSGSGSSTSNFTVLPPVPAITSATSTTVGQGKAFSYQITATNSPTSYAASGLPSGLTLDTTTGLITGSPKNVGKAAVTISATNAGGTGTARLIVTIVGLPVITSATSASADQGQAFSYQIAATNNPTSYAATGLPSGLILNTTTGLITGSPKNMGAAAVTISATNLAGTGTAKLTITILGSPAITSATNVAATVGKAFSYQITATNSPTSYAAPGLPSGLTLNTTTGSISGTPKNAGTAAVTISATNAAGTGTAKLTITIQVGAPVITSATTVAATVGTAFNYQITATNSPTSYGAPGLPTGLSLNATTGKITGSPKNAGTAIVTVSATNTTGTGTARVTLTITGKK